MKIKMKDIQTRLKEIRIEQALQKKQTNLEINLLNFKAPKKLATIIRNQEYKNLNDPILVEYFTLMQYYLELSPNSHKLSDNEINCYFKIVEVMKTPGFFYTLLNYDGDFQTRMNLYSDHTGKWYTYSREKFYLLNKLDKNEITNIIKDIITFNFIPSYFIDYEHYMTIFEKDFTFLVEETIKTFINNSLDLFNEFVIKQVPTQYTGVPFYVFETHDIYDSKIIPKSRNDIITFIIKGEDFFNENNEKMELKVKSSKEYGKKFNYCTFLSDVDVVTKKGRLYSAFTDNFIINSITRVMK